MQHVMGAAKFDGINISNTVAVVSIVMSYDSKEAFEIQLSNAGMKNPQPYRMLDYLSKSSVAAPGFSNNDFSKVLGISAKSRLQHVAIG